jgi:hypothetical protein
VSEAELEQKKVQLEVLRKNFKSSVEIIDASSKMKVESYEDPPPVQRTSVLSSRTQQTLKKMLLSGAFAG